MTEQIKEAEEPEQEGEEEEVQEEGEDWQEVGAKGKSCVTRRVAGTTLPATPIQVKHKNSQYMSLSKSNLLKKLTKLTLVTSDLLNLMIRFLGSNYINSNDNFAGPGPGDVSLLCQSRGQGQLGHSPAFLHAAARYSGIASATAKYSSNSFNSFIFRILESGASRTLCWPTLPRSSWTDSSVARRSRRWRPPDPRVSRSFLRFSSCI